MLNNSKQVVNALAKEELEAIEDELLNVALELNGEGYFPPFILIEYYKETRKAKVAKSFKSILEEKEGVVQYITYIDPTNGHPSIILKNLIAAISINIKEEKKHLRFISLRDKIAKQGKKIELKESLYFEATITKLKELQFNTWITNGGEEWHIDLKQVMDKAL